MFMEMREIISHHKMFQIELAENVKNWDKDEKIGDIFTASVSDDCERCRDLKRLGMFKKYFHIGFKN